MATIIKPNGEEAKDPPRKVTREDEMILSRAVVRLLVNKPFFGYIMANIGRKLDTTMDTYAAVGVTDRIMLWINPVKFNKLTQKEQEGMLEHEVMHIALDHIKRHPRESAADAQRWNIAHDIVINDEIDPGFKLSKLPPHGVNSERFGFPTDKTSEWYYNALESKMQTVTFALPGSDGEAGGTGEITVIMIDDHGKWGNNKETMGSGKALMSDVVIQAAINQLLDRAERETKAYGNLPGWLQQKIDQIRAPKMVPWHRVFRKFIAKGGKGKITYTKKRESKRYHTRPGVKLGNQLKVWVALDDSGSISDWQLSVFASELKHLANTGAEIMVMCADTEVTSVEPFKKRLKSVTGRGGTDLAAPFKWLMERKIKPDAFVYMTDGYGPTIDFMPFPTLWVFTQNSDTSVKWGQKVILRDKEIAAKPA